MAYPIQEADLWENKINLKKWFGEFWKLSKFCQKRSSILLYNHDLLNFFLFVTINDGFILFISFLVSLRDPAHWPIYKLFNCIHFQCYIISNSLIPYGWTPLQKAYFATLTLVIGYIILASVVYYTTLNSNSLAASLLWSLRLIISLNIYFIHLRGYSVVS